MHFFFDEPTTSLDSTVSADLMRVIRNLANYNRSIICILHQPSALIGSMLDKLILLAKGQVIYFGGYREGVSYFTTSPYSFKFAENSNPFDFFVNIASSLTKGNDSNVVPPEVPALEIQAVVLVVAARQRSPSPMRAPISTVSLPSVSTLSSEEAI